MAFTTDEILSYFTLKGANPLTSRLPENIDLLPAPGRGLFVRGREEAERRGNERDYSFGPRERRDGGDQRPGAGFGNPVYNLDKMEDVDVEEDYFQPLPPLLDDYGGRGAGDTVGVASLYERYSFDTDNSPHLPVTERREDVVRTVESNQVTIIRGATGSGKSTLVPQYILEHHARRHRHCNIVCTQPRRIATRSIAQYVTKTRGWKLGTIVGYQIYNDKVTSEDTRLTFVTTGVLLEKLIGMKNMNEYTHVILDEVHERNLETDFCLLLVRKLLRTNSRQVKVVLMSATLESREYSQYFAVRLPSQSAPTPAPVLSVEGRVWPVMEFYLDDLRALGEVERLAVDNPRVNLTQRQMCRALINYFNELEREDPNYGRGDFFRGTVLCFLPGMPDIRELERTLQENKFNLNQRLCILPLHSTISPEEQFRVFLAPEPGERKIILATNIAESSITVPDIKYVVDFCMVKQLLTDQETGFDRLVTTWASKAALKQRRGRAGRVAEGRCYRLITREFFRKYCPAYSIPEMQRRSIEHPVLKTKKLDMDEPAKILSLALQPPSRIDVEKAVTNLKELGALTVTCGGVVNPVDGDLTFVGSVLEALPISARLGRLVLLGHVFRCLEETVVIAAALSQRSIFTMPFNNEMKGYRSKIGWMIRTSSDCIAVLNAYKEWIGLKNSGYFKGKERREQSWCSDNMLHLRGLRDVAETVRDLSSRLARFGINVFRDLANVEMDKTDVLVLKVVLCGAFYPNYFRWGTGDEELNRRLFCGHNHCTTVMLAGLPPSAPKYAGDLCRMFSDCVDPTGPTGKALHFDGSKVFVEFEQRRRRGGQAVLDSVIISLKKGRMREPLSLYLVDSPPGGWMGGESGAAEDEKVEDLPENCSSTGIDIQPVELPRSGEVEVVVTQVVDAGHFWAQRNDRATVRSLRAIMDSIAHRTLLPLGGDTNKLQGTFCLAMFADDGLYYRARIDSTNLHHSSATVTFVDYGNTQTVPVTCLTKLMPHECQLAAQAMECYLTCVRPSAAHSSEGSAWAESANAHFEEIVRDRRLVARVFSRVSNTLRVELFDQTRSQLVTINEQLVLDGYAAKCEEPYLSKMAFAQVCAQEKAEQAASHLNVHRELDNEEGEGRMPNPVPLTSPSHQVVEWVAASSAAAAGSSVPRPSGPSHKVVLKGPSSPYEVKFYCMTNVGSLRPARIERDSVNSVVVDPEPQSKHEKMMVAANVALNPSGTATLARETTLMPSVLGLPYLLCLLFAPSAEMRCDAKKRRYVGAICGLGCDPITGQSLYHDHDMELIFDTLITQDDLGLVNCVRSCMNVMLSTDPAERGIVAWGTSAIKKIQREARSKLVELLKREREMANPYSHPKRGWNQVSPADVLLPQQPSSGATQGGGGDEEEGPDILVPFPLLSGIALAGLRPRVKGHGRMSIGELREAMRELHSKASKSDIPETLVCALCEAGGVSFSTPRELLDHLHGRPHMVRERRLWDDGRAPGLVSELQSSAGRQPPVAL